MLKKIEQLEIATKDTGMAQILSDWEAQTVMVNGVKSDSQKVVSGVPQVSVLGPLIFLILIGNINKRHFIQSS